MSQVLFRGNTFPNFGNYINICALPNLRLIALTLIKPLSHHVQDFSSICFNYNIQMNYGTPAIYTDDWKPKLDMGVRSFDHICDVARRLYHILPDFSKFHNIVSGNQIPLIFILISHLAVICVRTAFVVMTSIAFLLFDELDQRAEKLVERSVDNNVNTIGQQFSHQLSKWHVHYNLIIRITEKINDCFGFALLITTAIEFIVSMIEFQNILISKGNQVYIFRFCYIILRHFLIVVVSQRVISKVVVRINVLTKYILY